MFRSRKKAISWSFLILLVLSCSLVAQLSAHSNDNLVYLPLISKPLPYPLWAIKISASEDSHATEIVEMENGDLMVVGRVMNQGAIIMRLKPDGMILWQRKYSNTYKFISAEVTDDGGLVVGGLAETVSYQPTGLVLKLDANGAQVWARSFVDTHEIYDLTQTVDGGYLVAGYRGWVGPWIFKLNPDGTVAWQKQYGSPDGSVWRSVVATSDGGAIVTGEEMPCPEDHYRDFAMKLSSDGSTEWLSCFNSATLNAIAQAIDGGYVAVGYTSGGGWITKLSDDGQIVWQKAYEYPLHPGFQYISPLGNGGYIVSGQDTGDHSVLGRIDDNGELLWMRSYSVNHINTVFESEIGGFAAVGIYRDQQYNEHMLAMRVNDVGEIINCDIIDSVETQVNTASASISVRSKPGTASTFESHFSQPTFQPGSLTIDTLCTTQEAADSTHNADDTGC